MRDPTLLLRDIHHASSPSWWPPAPGWWLLAMALLLAGLVIHVLQRRRRQRDALHAGLFDDAWLHAPSGPARIAAASELLRRAARRRDADADRLQGDDWLEFLDQDDAARPFSRGPGRLLLSGGFMPDVDEVQAEAVRVLARERFLQWMRMR